MSSVDQRRVCVLDELTRELRDGPVEAGIGTDGVEDREGLLFGHLAVHLAERGREVDDPRTFFERDELRDDDTVRAGVDRQEVEGPLVPKTGEIGHR